MSAEETKTDADLPAPPSPEADEAARKLAAAEQETRLLYDQLIRLKAEFENYRKRVDREKPELVRHGKSELIERLLPLYDVLNAAHAQVARHAEGELPSAQELVRGLELIFKEFARLFEAEGVAAIECVGKPYDFDRHEVMGQVESDGQPEGTVVEELQRGYTLGGRTLRAAKVRVAVPKKKQ
ncbi:MAG: nucleotide exchange factor GrpE [Elusimicrobia bacterium]|nr:nucleotide exchange factor GrpE [Elusimicrobiota bacterium]